MDMLLSFSVANFGSIRDLHTLQMTADTSKDERGILLGGPPSVKERVGRVAAIYGANASGKSTMLDAIRLLSTMVRFSHAGFTPGEPLPAKPFALRHDPRPATFLAVHFVASGVRHLYEVEFTREAITREALFAWTTHRRSLWFERTGEKVRVGTNFAGDVELLRNQMRPNSLFLSVGAQNNHKLLMPVYAWFQRIVFRGTARSTRPGGHDIHTTEAFGDELLRSRAGVLSLLRAADVGIVDLRLDELPRDEDGSAKAMPRRFMIKMKHVGEAETWFPFNTESHGTRAMFDIAIKVATPLAAGGVVLLDELECSLHPALAAEIVRLFQDPARSPKGTQLVFTTHDIDLLSPRSGPPVLRRDQVWFTEKSTDGATKLYPLSDYHPREGESLERGYMQGRYGAVPFLGRLAVAPTEEV